MDAHGDAVFRTTRWSLVASVREADPGAARAALEELCRTYWYPLYAFLRRGGSDAEEAADLTQGFFAALVEKDYVGQADRQRGRFRTFLLAALRHYASKERAKAGARKRGGDRTILSLDFEDGERRYRREPADRLTPEAMYERRWALTLLDRALTRLAEHERGGGAARAERFEALRPLLAGEGNETYRQIGERLGMSETAVKVAVHRMRGRYRDILRREIADTVAREEQIDDEIRRLMEVLRA